MIGDRFSDMLAAKKAKAYAINIPFKNRPEEKNKIRKLKYKKKYIMKDFLKASKFIIKKEK